MAEVRASVVGFSTLYSRSLISRSRPEKMGVVAKLGLQQ
jgi:hypothetical protein